MSLCLLGVLWRLLLTMEFQWNEFCNARKLTNVSVFSLSNNHSSVFAFLPAAMVHASDYAHFCHNERRPNALTNRFVLHCTRLCAKNFSRVGQQRRGEENFRLHKQWLFHFLLQLEDCGYYALRFCGCTRLGRYIRSSEEGPHAIQGSL